MDPNILKSVSRSFYLTLKVLPRPFREPVSLAYLLARATDTLADTTSVPTESRLELLSQLSHLIASENPDQSDTAHFGDRLTHDFTPGQTDPAEATLLLAAPRLLASLANQPQFQKAAIREVLAEIITGQTEDLRHFPSQGGLIHALPDSAALDRYTRLVAGCVGEFWTRLGYQTYGKKYSLTPEPEMSEDGIRLGKALQLVNILRDLPEDLAAGRCYLPADQLAEAGLTFPIPIPATDPELASLFSQIRPSAENWLEICSDHLDRGLSYTMKVRHRRLRFAIALPLNIATRTKSLLKRATSDEWIARVKVPRTEIKKIGKKTAIGFFAAKPLQRLYTEFSN